MNNFSGKKALCFIALPHHNRFLVPIMEALQRNAAWRLAILRRPPRVPSR